MQLESVMRLGLARNITCSPLGVSRNPLISLRPGWSCKCVITSASQSLGRSRGLVGLTIVDRYEKFGNALCSDRSISIAENAGTDSGTNAYLIWFDSNGVMCCAV